MRTSLAKKANKIKKLADDPKYALFDAADTN